jgi:hypothetical protein
MPARFTMRSPPSRLLAPTSPPPPSGTFLEPALVVGWVILEEVPGRELVAGTVTPPWKPAVQVHGLPPPEQTSGATP